MEKINQDKESYLLLLDQSKAYKIVCHRLLIRKLRAIGFCNQAIDLLSSFMDNRKQYVQIEGLRSNILDVGPRSVIQGSTLSSVFFLIFILDMPSLFHHGRTDDPNDDETECEESNHSPENQRKCPKLSLKTFVNDGYVLGTKEDDKTFEESISKTMNKIQNDMSANRLILNEDKSQVMLFTKNKEEKLKFEMEMKGKIIRHRTEVTILGNVLKDDLSWDSHIEKVVLPQLRNRVRSLRILTKYLDRGFRAQYVNAIFKSKLLFGIESWGGVKLTLLNRVQDLQNQASKLAVPKDLMFKSNRQREKVLKWKSVKNEVLWATFVHTYKIINMGIPEELAVVMPRNNNGLRMSEQKKLAKKPSWLNRNKSTRASFRNRAYSFNTLPKNVTSQEKFKDFKKNIKKILRVKMRIIFSRKSVLSKYKIKDL